MTDALPRTRLRPVDAWLTDRWLAATRLPVMIMSAGALLLPLMVLSKIQFNPRDHVPAAAAFQGLSDVVTECAPLLAAWLAAAMPATLAWIVTARKPPALAGRNCMGFSAFLQVLAIGWVILGCAWPVIGLALVAAAMLPAAVSVPYALVGWGLLGWSARRRRHGDGPPRP